jgi:hypothetical protein
MSSQIDFRTLPANVPVLCIPRVYPNINEARIRRIFDDLNMGELERIDIVPKTSVKQGANPLEKGEKFNRVFVHFKRWNNSENSNLARERLLNGKEIKIIYDELWFWKISAYREPATRRELAPQQHPTEDRRTAFKPTIAFDSDEDKYSKPQYSSNRDDRYQRPHRRDDSRERPQRDDRRYTREYPSDRPHRRDERPQRQEMSHRKNNEPTVSSTLIDSPDTNTTIQSPMDYGNIVLPPMKKRLFGVKKSETKTLKIETEDGEVIEKSEEKESKFETEE